MFCCGMACEACSAKFSLFKRKKQCMDCLRFFCTDCVIRRVDRVLCCDNCSMLSRRPLIRSQILQMRSRDLRQYLVAKKVSVRGCVEKEDLVNLLIVFANGSDCLINDRFETGTGTFDRRTFAERPNPDDLSTRRSRSPPSNIERPIITEEPRPERRIPEPEVVEEPLIVVNENENENEHENEVEIEELSGSDEVVNGPEPVITENDEISEPPVLEGTEVFSEAHSRSRIVKLSDIKEISELEYLTVKQLKDLLSINRVDFKGCVERCELLDRACRLWDEHRKSRAANIDNLDDETLCKVCLDAPIECVILECGHMACCINCGKQMSECPICRQYVVRVVRFFKA
ncbi:E3 ubiquitin-protein ligase RNF34 [Belonocnema kinseyi]|uniref:E3 ubiquitin-protein ligase RNF34 n=1 Tax=Belonocnema kinseyi TaxID=2817044 RepID=UPI00143D72F6|nr:E3 ubiquitin-protein ligase RNF34 [Belonocnema kinseyi]